MKRCWTLIFVFGMLYVSAARNSAQAQFVSTKAGTIAGIVGEVFLDDKAITLPKYEHIQMKQGQRLRTEDDGNVLVQLTPTAVLMLYQNGSLQIINDDLTDVRIKLEKGAISIDAGMLPQQKFPKGMITVQIPSGVVQLRDNKNRGSFWISSDTQGVWANGATATAIVNNKEIAITSGHMIHLDRDSRAIELSELNPNAKAGVVQYVLGKAFVGDAPMPPQRNLDIQMQNGQQLRTENGFAEIVLYPHRSFLRIGENSALRIIRNHLDDLQLELEKGFALVDIDLNKVEDFRYRWIKQTHVPPFTIKTPFGVIQLHKPGRYRISSDSRALWAYRGSAAVTKNEGNEIVIEEGQMARFDRDLNPTRLKTKDADLLSLWTLSRSKHLTALFKIQAEKERIPVTIHVQDPWESYSGSTYSGSTYPSSISDSNSGVIAAPSSGQTSAPSPPATASPKGYH